MRGNIPTYMLYTAKGATTEPLRKENKEQPLCRDCYPGALPWTLKVVPLGFGPEENIRAILGVY